MERGKEIKRADNLFKIMFLILCCVFIVGINRPSTVYGASASTMKKAYQNYVSNHRGEFRYYAYANIGPDKKPALLTADELQGGAAVKCKVYYYVNNKVKFLASYGTGARQLTLMSRGGNYYIYTGTSSDSCYACVRNNKVQVTALYNMKLTSYSTKKTNSQYGNKAYTEYYLSYSNYAAYKSKYKTIKTIAFAKAPAETRTIPVSWQKTYYKSISKNEYVRISFKKSNYTADFYRNGRKIRTIETGSYKTWESEHIMYESNGKLMYGNNYGILYSMCRKNGGKVVEIEGVKHLYTNQWGYYLFGTFYSSLGTARNHIQKVWTY